MLISISFPKLLRGFSHQKGIHHQRSPEPQFSDHSHALGGGTFLVQNKELPGAYINFVSKAAATATLSERGIATMPLELDWGKEGEIFEVTNGDFQKNSII